MFFLFFFFLLPFSASAATLKLSNGVEIPLTTTRETTPALNLMINGTHYYAPMTTTDLPGPTLRLMVNGVKYSVGSDVPFSFSCNFVGYTSLYPPSAQGGNSWTTNGIAVSCTDGRNFTLNASGSSYCSSSTTDAVGSGIYCLCRAETVNVGSLSQQKWVHINNSQSSVSWCNHWCAYDCAMLCRTCGQHEPDPPNAIFQTWVP